MSAKREVWTFQLSILAMLSITLADDGWMKKKFACFLAILISRFWNFGTLEIRKK